jgi:predicted Zn-dependent protease
MLEREGRTAEAIEHYRAAMRNKPNFRMAHFQLGRLLLAQKKTAEAIAELSQTLAPEDADTPRFMYTLAIAHAEAGDYARAASYFREAGQRAAALGQDALAAQIATAIQHLEERAAR